MKKKKLNLSFNKETISHLQMNETRGGGTNAFTDVCEKTITCLYTQQATCDCSNIYRTCYCPTDAYKTCGCETHDANCSMDKTCL